LRRDRPLNGYLDRLRENLEVLDEAIANARKMSKPKGKSEKALALQYGKLVRDLVDQRNVTLTAIKAHLLGRDETGAVNEPQDSYRANEQIEFERYFHDMLSPWTEDHVKLECEDCGVKSEDVSNRHISHPYPKPDEYYDLCKKCYDKRTKSNGESEDTDVANITEPASKRDIGVLLQSARLMIRTLKGLPIDQRIAKLEELLADKPQVAPGMEPALEAYRALMQKELDKTKAAAPLQ